MASRKSKVPHMREERCDDRMIRGRFIRHGMIVKGTLRSTTITRAAFRCYFEKQMGPGSALLAGMLVEICICKEHGWSHSDSKSYVGFIYPADTAIIFVKTPSLSGFS